MSYGVGFVSLLGLSLSSILLLATLSWMVNHRHARPSIAWLLALSTLIVLQSLEFIYHESELYKEWPIFLKIVDPLVVLLPFTIYGYIRSLQGDRQLGKPRALLLHCSPAIVVALLAVPYWSLDAAEKIRWMDQGRSHEANWNLITPFDNTYLAIIAGLGLFYWLLQQRHAPLPKKNSNSRWIKGLQAVQLFSALALIVRILFSKQTGIYISVAYSVAPFCAYFLYLLLTLNQPPRVLKPTVNSLATGPQQSEQNDEQLGTTTSTATLSETEHEALLFFRELEQVMANGAYADNNLSLGKLAALCQLTSHQTSAAINQCSGTNFYDWVNGYRIQAAKQALQNSNAPVADICFAVGFNSKSTFNTAFRKSVGCTPTEYRRQACVPSAS